MAKKVKRIRVQFELPDNLPAVQALLQAAHDQDKSIHRLCKDVCLKAYGYNAEQPMQAPSMMPASTLPASPLNTAGGDTKGMLGRAASLDDDGEF